MEMSNHWAQEVTVPASLSMPSQLYNRKKKPNLYHTGIITIQQVLNRFYLVLVNTRRKK